MLHHVNRSSGVQNGDRAPTLSSGQFSGEADSEFVLGIWQSYELQVEHLLNVKVLKNRFGENGMTVKLGCDMSRMQLTDRSGVA